MIQLEMKPKDTWKPIVINAGQNKVYIYRQYNAAKDFTAYCVQACVAGRVIRRSRRELTEAKQEAEKLATDIQRDERTAAKTSLRDLSYYLKCEKALNGVPLHVAVAFWHQHNSRPAKSASVAKVVRDFLFQLAEDPTLSKAHLDTRRCHLNRFSDEMGKRGMQSVTASQIDAWLQKPDWQRSTRHNVRRSIIALFNYARRKGHINRNIRSEAELSEQINFKTKNPDIYSVADAKAVLAQADYVTTPFLVFGAFAGLRTQEIQRLTWKHVDWKNGLIRLTRDVTKTGRERLVPMMNNLQLWLKPYRSLSGNVLESLGISYPRLNQKLRSVAGAAGGDWKRNGWRHSFASYYLAYTEDPGKTSMACGHSIEVLESIYKAIEVQGNPITKVVAEQYFEIVPSA